MHVQYLCGGNDATEKYAAFSGSSIQKSYRFTVTDQLPFAIHANVHHIVEHVIGITVL